MIEVDARGLTCPVPVVKTKKAIEGNPGGKIAVLVDSKVSVENVSRLAESQGYSIEIEEIGDDFRLNLSPPEK